MNTQVFKIASANDWAAAITTGVYMGSADDARDGFVHLSVASQLPGTLEKHFKGQTDLLLIAFNAAELGPELKWEKSRGGEYFPHFYGALPTAKCLWTHALDRDTKGSFLLDEGWFC
jgi:uncharacterized protein (DUF952 family)